VAKTVEYHNPDFEDGIVFSVGGLAIPNGGGIELSEDEELSFVAKHQMSVSDFFEGDKQAKVSGKSSLSKEVFNAHIGKNVTDQAGSLDAAVLADVEPPVDSEGNEVETEGSALDLVEDKEADE